MTDEAKHTPTPWRVEGLAGPYPCEVYGTTFRGARQLIARCSGAKVRDGNAAFIVKAVNAHDDLVEALRNSQQAIRELRENGAPHAYWDDIEKANLAALSLDAALAKANAS